MYACIGASVYMHTMNNKGKIIVMPVCASHFSVLLWTAYIWGVTRPLRSTGNQNYIEILFNLFFKNWDCR